ncbi:c-type cytochrome biogenesis protein CcsB [Actinoalloteichus hymeniacidonis]|uniref:Cytochrome c-type biogenesis protein CcsB n=1 Tax=Actinoalloteichus hymeniacidonis TaxID=340345 RepID=A0AAC9HLD1_9PSEU|nr:c-type cytochrome biogenesis protein CcsB [Actinoalloteichus hymeniacidonis]AOS61330.1 cytochrome c-type biogenesis protein CcsB [Actinoalloteichus hymeniacidonis]MBB5910665.1 cytochrome c-type biogenesis protein CcsB [Actinoalloteichus hymeniacidonis]
MPVDETLSTYSDLCLASALIIYVFALLLQAAEYGFTRKTAADNKRAALVGAGGGSSTADAGADTASPATPQRRPLPERLGRMGVSLTVLGALVQLSSLVLRGLSTGRVPWGNMYEYTSALSLAAVVAWLIVLRKHPVRVLGVFVLLPVFILYFLAGTVLYADAAPLVPSLQSIWIVIHVSAAIIGSGIFLVSGAMSVAYLIKTAHDSKPRRFAFVGARLPAASTLDRVAYRSAVFAFPVLTFGIICGAIWAEAAWGRFWGWDPKETVAFICWVIYAGYLHARATTGWRGVPAAWINVLAFSVNIFNLFFINLVIAGLHSYASVG